MAKKNGFMQRFIQMTRDLNCELPNQPLQSNGVWDELERVSLVNGRRSFSYRKGWGGGGAAKLICTLSKGTTVSSVLSTDGIAPY